jgi:hypothetical protein
MFWQTKRSIGFLYAHWYRNDGYGPGALAKRKESHKATRNKKQCFFHWTIIFNRLKVSLQIIEISGSASISKIIVYFHFSFG